MGKNEAWDNGRTAEIMPRESQETKRGRGRLRDLESGGVKKSDPGHYPCSISAGRLMEDFQRITHHETDYSGTEGRRKKKMKEGGVRM